MSSYDRPRVGDQVLIPATVVAEPEFGHPVARNGNEYIVAAGIDQTQLLVPADQVRRVASPWRPEGFETKPAPIARPCINVTSGVESTKEHRASDPGGREDR